MQWLLSSNRVTRLWNYWLVPKLIYQCTSCFPSTTKVVNIYDRHGEHRNDVIITLPGWDCLSLILHYCWFHLWCLLFVDAVCVHLWTGTRMAMYLLLQMIRMVCLWHVVNWANSLSSTKVICVCATYSALVWELKLIWYVHNKLICEPFHVTEYLSTG